jgi:hypothetical protein
LNKVQKEITKAQLKEEQRALKELKKSYEQAKHDIELKISALNARNDMQNLQSIIYQKKYQQELLRQIDSVLSDLNKEQYSTITDFMNGSYVNGYIGSMYDLQNQGIPITVPINPKKMKRAVMTNSKLSKSYYQNRVLPENLGKLKRNIRTELTRGIASGKTWLEVAYQVANGMNSPFNRAMKDAMRIVRTEGHRINQEGFLDAGDIAKTKGADIVKQWDSTLDSATRPWHQEADGQIVEWDDYFIVNGEKLKAPSVGGSASNVINCRCQLLQRARWALDEEELKTLEERAQYFGLDKAKSFEEFKDKYLQLPDSVDTINVDENEIVKAFKEKLDHMGVEYREVSEHETPLTESEIIAALAGGDKTSGSCASVALAYVGQKNGLDVLDFRGGASQDFFSMSLNLQQIMKLPNITQISARARATATAGKKLLSKVEEGMEYYFVCGRHASIVRKEKGILQYLELQSATKSGWTDFDGNVRYTLATRFGATQTGSDYEEYMFNVADAKGSKELQEILGYINTAENAQKKGAGGSVK